MKRTISCVKAVFCGAAAGILLGCASVAKDPGRPLKVLAIGNSFSYSLIHEWPQVAKAAGCNLDFATLWIGGCTFETHVAKMNETNYPYAFVWDYRGDRTPEALPYRSKVVPQYFSGGKRINHYKANFREIVTAEEWDVITIQQGSPQSWKWGSYRFAADLIALLRELAPRAEIRVQQTWSYCMGDWRVRDPFTGGPGRWGIDLARMYDRLTMNYARLAEANRFKTIPTGVAVQEYRRLAGLTSYEGDVVGDLHKTDRVWSGTDGDSIHLNKSGNYLQALVWTGALFGADPRKIAYRPDYLDDAKATRLREAAALALEKGVPRGGDPLAGRTYCAGAEWLHRFARTHGMWRVEPAEDRIDTVMILVGTDAPDEEKALAAYARDLRKKRPDAELIFIAPAGRARGALRDQDVRLFELPKASVSDEALLAEFEKWF